MGREPNPSPQMAVWTLLKNFLGEEKRNQLIVNTGIQQPDIERTYDDVLEERNNSVNLVF